MKTIISLAMACSAVAATAATISITGQPTVGADGIVTVTYSLDADAIVTADFRENGVSLGGTNQWSLAGDVFKLVPAGTGTITWNAAKDVPGRQFSAVTVELKAWAESDAPDYLIADLMVGSTCRLRYYPSVDCIPGGIVADEGYRMYYLPMRKIRARGVTWTMGTTSEKGRSTSNEDAHQVTLNANYYIGVFELTHAQCAACGVSRAGNFNEEYRWRLTPQNRTTWNGYRGTQPPAAPSDGSTFGKIKARTGLLVDFPTEAQWEYAARGGYGEGTWGDGSTILASSGTDANLSKLACYKGTKNTMISTGSYLPNGYGLYDMHGNVIEMCQDWYRADITTLNGVCNADGAHYVDDETSEPTVRVQRGGYYSTAPSSCRASSRASIKPGDYKTESGCRVMTYANLGEEVAPTVAVSQSPFALDTRRDDPQAAATTASTVELRSSHSVFSVSFAIDMLKQIGTLILFQ
ncbi:MAG: formylglycine-generating enzyme family protein [Kiritimatiellae bacterium]|nr:formylglycine-generating enzyme family protein [Kiritimatiellia bacterium]